VAAIASAENRDGANLPEPICWRQLSFSIPFKIAADVSPAEQPAEFRLFVSANLGVKWDLAQTARAGDRAFNFQAPGDGEYWFQIRSIDRQGRLSMDAGGPPELRVIIDTMQPRLDLSVVRGEAGEIKARWQAVDPTLDANSLKIEYQNASGQWKPVAVDRPPPGGDRSTTTGTLTWYPNDAAPGTVPVRAEISDRAGNVTVTTAQAKSEFALPPTSASASPPRGPLTASIPAPDSSAISKWQSLPSWTSAPQVDAPGHWTPPTSNLAGTSGATQWPADRTAAIPLGRNPIPSVDPNPPLVADRTWEWANPAIRNQASRIDSPRQETSQPQSPAPAATTPIGASRPSTPSGVRPQMVNSRTFDIDYEVGSVGGSGIAKVELWGTRDGGRTWSSYGTDNDNRSPIRAVVEGEGVYGFTIVVQSGSGVSGLPPRSGDQPQVWIAVDLTKPVVQSTGIRPGDGPHSGELLIGWDARDASLADRPITILYSDRPGGPWTIIAAGLDNNGQFAWRPDSRIPDQVFLRIEARDEAGNVGAFETPQSITLDRKRPEGKIRGVRPAAEQAGRVQVYEFR
jgi:hypothetical protein